jgi:Domain of unknown function DUF11
MVSIQFNDEQSKFAPAVRDAQSLGGIRVSLQAGTASQRKETNRSRWLAYVRLAPFWLFLLTLLSAFGRTSAAAPTVSYALTTTTDSVAPGKTVQFRVTLTNLTTTSQSVSLSYKIPNFTHYSSYPAGTAFTYNVGTVAAGASESVDFDFMVLSGTQTPPNGSAITLLISDVARGVSVSRTATVRSAPTATLDLSTQQGTVAPGGSFTYTLAYHNASAGTLTASQLSLPVPVGSSFVSADGAGVLGTDGVVRWTLSTLAPGATGQVHLNLKATTTTGARPALLLQAAFRDSGGQYLAQASDAKTILAVPAISYSLTTTTNSVGTGQILQFKATVTNLATTSQSVSFSYHIPNYTAYSSYPAGTYFTYNFGAIAAGTSQSVNLSFTVLSGTQTPSKGSLSTLVISDDARGGSVSRTVTVNP